MQREPAIEERDDGDVTAKLSGADAPKQPCVLDCDTRAAILAHPCIH